jgi:hypothetical protein
MSQGLHSILAGAGDRLCEVYTFIVFLLLSLFFSPQSDSEIWSNSDGLGRRLQSSLYSKVCYCLY